MHNMFLAAAMLAALIASTPSLVHELPAITINDNRQPAGTLADGTLVLKLRAARGQWRPEGESGPALEIEALGETGKGLSVPAPLIRVPEGTAIVVSVRNELATPLRVHGWCARDGNPCSPLEVPAGETREVRFVSGRVGTYHYWASTTNLPQSFRGAADTQLSGAFIVDPPNAARVDDRIFVITEWTSLTNENLAELLKADDTGILFAKLKPRFTFLINGLSWPATERLTYRVGEPVRWRVINLSTQRHPMHMHGFYFDVDSLGDGMRDTAYADAEKPKVVTQLMAAGMTMAMTWTPERVGNWLFHCHVMEHVSPERRIDDAGAAQANHHAAHDKSAGMRSMILGVTVVDNDRAVTSAASESTITARKITLTMKSDAGRYGDAPAYGFVLDEGQSAAASSKVAAPGPTLALRRGEPVEITLVNQLPEGTAIHWHGMELDSYYDGVHGWSGVGERVTPLIEPGGTFVARFTPPRAGTFIYHTHLHDNRQLASGLYGAMVVLEPGQELDPSSDHVVVLGRGGPGRGAPAVLNGEKAPQFVWKAGTRHRVRFINITPDDILSVTLQTIDGPVTWKPLTKDGAPLHASQCKPKLARQVIAVGETYDFEYDVPPGRQNLWIEVRNTGGKWQVQGHIIAK